MLGLVQHCGAPGWDRTSDTEIFSLLLLPTELPVRLYFLQTAFFNGRRKMTVKSLIPFIFHRHLNKISSVALTVFYPVTDRTNKNAFLQLFFDAFPTLVCYRPNLKILITLCVMKLQTSRVPIISATDATTTQKLDGGYFCPKPPYFCIAGGTPLPFSVL